MSKTDNVEQTGKLFKQMKMLLIHTIGCTIIIGLPIVQMNKLLKQFAKLFQACSLIMEWAMLLSIVFISFVIVINFKAFILTIENGNYSISHWFKMIAELIICLTI